jgi:sugar porter (SP) family MFS transporter
LIPTPIMDEKHTKNVATEPTHTENAMPTNEKEAEIQLAPPPDYTGPKAKTDHLEDARGWESENLIHQLDKELEQSGYKKGFFDLEFKNPKHFTWMLVAFASMGGLLSGLDQSLISGANLTLPKALGLTDQQNSLVNSGMPLGGMYTCKTMPVAYADQTKAVAGAFLISPCNEYFGRRWAILISCILYTIGGALEAGSVNYGMIVAARVILGAGVGLEGGTVPVYVAETVEARLRGNLVSLYQFNIALGEVLGYAVAAMFIKVPGNWRYILGSSLVFSTIMGIGILFMPESPRYLMHKKKPLEAYKVWRRIRGVATHEAREEFFVMKISTEEEAAEVAAGRTNRFPWMDFFTKPRARRAIIYANIMIFLGQFTGINAIMYYMSVLMSQVGFNTYDATYMSLVGGGCLLLGTIPAIFLMETCGRRFWAIAMLPGFFIGLVLVGISYQLNTLSAQLGVYLTGLILYELFFGSYAALTWVIPSEVYPTYLRSYGMTTSTGWLFLSSFIVTYNFTGMQNAMGKTGLSLGFYGGIAVVGWFYQIFFMPETKDKTLEEIDQLFHKPTRQVVRENMVSSWEVTNDLMHLRFRKVFIENNQRRHE